MTKHIGRLLVLEIAIAPPSADPAGLTFLRVGAMRDKSLSVDWETADGTTDDSADFNKEESATFKVITLSGSGVYDDTDAKNVELLEDHILAPGVSTSGQPHAWVRLTYPSGRIMRGCMLFKQWKIDAPYTDYMTYSTEATSAGAFSKIAG